MGIVILMKLSMVALMQSWRGLVLAVNSALASLDSVPQFKLFVVMICIPLAMNTLQFVLTDSFIKKRRHQAVPVESLLAERQGRREGEGSGLGSLQESV